MRRYALLIISAFAALGLIFGFAALLPAQATQGYAIGNTLPTTQVLLSGTGATYNTPTGALWLDVECWGGGGGGAGSGTSPGAPGAGTATTFGSSLFTANGGAVGSSVGGSAAGGTATGGYINITGGNGDFTPPNTNSTPGGRGGENPLGGAGVAGGPAHAGGDARANTGAGGGGGGQISTASGGGGGAAGGLLRGIINAPVATYTYTIGALGAAGTLGTGGVAGGAGSNGGCIVVEHYNY